MALGVIADALLIPVSNTYEKVLEGTVTVTVTVTILYCITVLRYYTILLLCYIILLYFLRAILRHCSALFLYSTIL